MKTWGIIVTLVLSAVVLSCKSTQQAEPEPDGVRQVDKKHAQKVVSESRDMAKSPPPPSPSNAVASQAEKSEPRPRFKKKSASGSPPLTTSPYDGAGRRASRSKGHLSSAPLQIARPRPRPTPVSQEKYQQVAENNFKSVTTDPLSTFSIDVDTASYSNMRRMLTQGTSPPPAAVRIEEMINYFDYDYDVPDGAVPFSTQVEIAECPWAKKHLLAKIGLKGKTVATDTRPPANLVFLLDVSGSMNRPNKLPLLVRSLKMAVNQLGERDRVAIVVYAGASGMVLPSTPFTYRQRIMEALDSLSAGGSTNAGEGIELAYKTAEDHFVKGGINRVILATDGDFNVGIRNKSALKEMVMQKAKKGVFLTVLGLGMGNLKDDMLETLADKGNGNYAYIDNFQEARKVFSEQINGTLVTIAKDVKIQVEFNPALVDSYRLIGYENRMLAAQDFNDDTKDAGEIGAGHTVTALYEIVPAGVGSPRVDPLKYQKNPAPPTGTHTDEIMTLKLRYKQPDQNTSQKLEYPIRATHTPFAGATADFRFAAAVAGFGMLLKHSEFKGDLTYQQVIDMAEGARGSDKKGYRVEAIRLMSAARDIAK